MIRKYAWIFCWKNVSSFCSAKATHILSAKNIRILYIESAKTVNEMTLNELVKLTTLWTTGLWWVSFFRLRTKRKLSIFWMIEPPHLKPWKYLFVLRALDKGNIDKRVYILNSAEESFLTGLSNVVASSFINYTQSMNYAMDIFIP